MVLTSLPHPGRHDFRGSTQYRLLNVYRQDFGEQKGLWSPQMMVLEPRACDRSMLVLFTAPLAEFNFKWFILDLYGDRGHYIGRHRVEWFGEEMLSKTFEEINMSYNELYIILLPDHHDDCGTCKRSRSYQVKWTDENCRLPYFPVEPEDDQPPDPVSSDGISAAGIIGIVIVAVVVPGGAVLGVCVHRKVTGSRSVLVVYDGFNTTSPHGRAVDALCTLIQNCKLGNVEKYNMFEPACLTKIPYDLALFVNSDNIAMHLANFHDSNSGDPPIFEIFKSFAPSDVHCVRFMYSRNCSFIPHISIIDPEFTKKAFWLPGDITLLLRWVNRQKSLKTDVSKLQEMHDMKAAVAEVCNSQPVTNIQSGYNTSQTFEPPLQFEGSIVGPPMDDNFDGNTLIDCQTSEIYHGLRSVSEIGSNIGEEVTKFNRENLSLQRQESVYSNHTIAQHDV